MQLVDTHVHVAFDSFQDDLMAVRDRWRAAGVTHLVHSCVEPDEFDRNFSLVELFPELSLSIGLHPLEANRWSKAVEKLIRERASTTDDVVAIGELGLDLYRNKSSLEMQVQACWGQLKIARDLGKPVIVHCRDAAAEFRDLLGRFWEEEGPIDGVMHCWNGSPLETEWFLDFGFYVSFSGILTFKNAEVVRESARIVPKDRLLVETDCPFLAPQQKRGRRNEPAFVRYVAEVLAEARSEDLSEVAEMTSRNAFRLFGLRELNVDPDIAVRTASGD